MFSRALRSIVTASLAALAMVCASVSARADPAFPPEPNTLWPGPMQGATPRTLRGATVIDADAFQALVAKQAPVLLDVANKEHQPQDLPKGAMWFPVHRSVPGALWLPGAGTGKDAPGFADAFAERVATATGGDKNKPIVAFCHARRWGSWNAAKRLTQLGYRHVYWYPGGSEGWGAQAPMREVVEDPRWQKAGFDRSSAGDMPDAAAGAR